MAEQVVRVFISSTFEDFIDERRAVSSAVQELNLTFRALGIAFVPVDLRRGARPDPPQEECLAEVSRCRILVGLLGSRYGQGITELEYDKACELSLPVLIYVRDPHAPIVPAWMDTDPALMTRNSLFREKVEKVRTRDLFTTSEQLRGHVLRDLGRVVLEMFVQGTEHEEAGHSEQLPAGPTGSAQSEAQGTGSNDRSEVEHLLSSVSAKLNNISTLDGETRRRLYLFGASMFYGTELAGTLGNHEIHLLYRDRSKITPVDPEIGLVLRTLCADGYNASVGWFWVRAFSNKAVRDLLRWLSLNSWEDAVRVGALNLIAGFPIRSTEKILRSSALDGSEKVALASLRILERLGTARCLNTLDQVESQKDNPLRDAARKAKLSVLLRVAPEKAIDYVCATETPEATFGEPSLRPVMSAMALHTLRGLRRGADEKMATLATRELLRRKQIDTAELDSLIKSSDLEIRCGAYGQSIEKGAQFDIKQVRDTWQEIPRWPSGLGLSLLASPSLCRSSHSPEGADSAREDVTAKILETYPDERLWQIVIEWLNPVSPLAYRVWGLKKGRHVLPQIRTNLRTNFKDIRETYVRAVEWLKDARGKAGDAPKTPDVESMIENLSKYDNQTLARFTEASLRILLANGETQDVDISLEYITHVDAGVKHLAKELLVRFADERHLTNLVEIGLSDEAIGLRAKAAQKALSLDEGELVSERFLRSNDATIVKLVLQDKLRRNSMLQHGAIDSLLHHWGDEIREITVAYLVEAFGNRRVKLEALLSEYVSRTPHYYSVVCWLDRILYAPPVLRKPYRLQLAGKIKNAEEGRA